MKNVKEVLGNISTKSSMASQKDIQDLVIALMTDKKHAAKVCKIENNEIVVKEERILADDFKALVVDVMTKAGLSKEEAEVAADNYRPKKEVADMIINLHQELLFQYAAGKGKNTKIMCKPEFDLTLKIDAEPTETTVFSVPNPEKGIERKPIRKVKKRKARISARTTEAMKISL